MAVCNTKHVCLFFALLLSLLSIALVALQFRMLDFPKLHSLGYGNSGAGLSCDGTPIDYIVTGGAGFIGSTLVKALRAPRNHPKGASSPRVVVVDNLWRGTLENLRDDYGKPVINLEKDFLNVDLTDQKATFASIRCAKVVYHLADIVAGVDVVFGNQGFVFAQNQLINTNVLAACRRNHINHYIYVGTACSFPKHLQMSYDIAALHENQTYPASPESSYGWSKLMGEYEALLMLKEPDSVKVFRPNVTVLRFHNVYGPGMDFGRTSQALPALIRKAINYPEVEPFEVWGSGQQYRDFTYVDDVVEALLLARTQAVNFGTVQIGTGNGVTLKESAAIVTALAKEAFGKDIPIRFTSSKPEGDRGRVAVLERAERVLHWKPRVQIAEGLARTFAWVAWRMLGKESTTKSIKEKLRTFFESDNKDGVKGGVSLPSIMVLKKGLVEVAEQAYIKAKPQQVPKPMKASKTARSDAQHCDGPLIDYIVTGGAGFIGSTLVKALLRESSGSADGKPPRIVVLDNLWRGKLANLKYDNGEPVIDLDMDFVNVDLTDRQATFRAVRCAKVVYHLADIVAGLNFVFGNQGFVFSQNLLINTNVLAACRQNHINHYIYVGTACSFPKHLQMSYGIAALHENQTYPASPESSYGWSKLMGEYEAQLMLKEPKSVKIFRPNITVLRLHNVYGPGMDFGQNAQALPALARKAINHPEVESFTVWGSGQQYRDFTYVDDIVDALLLARSNAVNFGTVQIGTGNGVTLKESAAMVTALGKAAFGHEIPSKFSTDQPEGDRGRVAVLDRAQKVLHWRPKIGIAEGLARTFVWVAWQMYQDEGLQESVKKKLHKFFKRENKKDGISGGVVTPPTPALAQRLKTIAEAAYLKEKKAHRSVLSNASGSSEPRRR